MSTRLNTKNSGGIPDWARRKKEAAIYGFLARAMGTGGQSSYGGSPFGRGAASVTPVDRAFSAADVAPQSHNDQGTARMYLEIMAKQRAEAEAARNAPVNDGRETRDRGPSYLERIAIDKARNPETSPYNPLSSATPGTPPLTGGFGQYFQPEIPGAGTTLGDDARELAMQQARMAPGQFNYRGDPRVGMAPGSMPENAPPAQMGRIAATNSQPREPLSMRDGFSAELAGLQLPDTNTQVAGGAPFSLPPLMVTGTGARGPTEATAQANTGQIPLNSAGMALSGIPMPIPTPPQPNVAGGPAPVNPAQVAGASVTPSPPVPTPPQPNSSTGQPDIDPAQFNMRIAAGLPQPTPSVYAPGLPLSGMTPQQIALAGQSISLGQPSSTSAQADAGSPFSTLANQVLSNDDRLYAAGTNPAPPPTSANVQASAQVPLPIAGIKQGNTQFGPPMPPPPDSIAQAPIPAPSVPQAAPAPPDMQTARLPRPRPDLTMMASAPLPRPRPALPTDVASIAAPLMSLMPTPPAPQAPMPTRSSSQPKSNYVYNRDNSGRFTGGGFFNNRSYMDPTSRSYRLTNSTGNAPTGSR